MEIDMKKYIIVILLAIFIGGIFAYIFLNSPINKTMSVNKEDQKVFLFQLGVFKNKDNAYNLGNNNIVKEINEYYYVYGAILSDIELINTMKEYYEFNNIEYQVKEVIIDYNFYEELRSYEKLMVESNNINVILNTNKIILDKYSII